MATSPYNYKTVYCLNCCKRSNFFNTLHGGLYCQRCNIPLKTHQYTDNVSRLYLNQFDPFIQIPFEQKQCVCGHVRKAHVYLGTRHVNVETGSVLLVAKRCKKQQCKCLAFSEDNLKWLALQPKEGQ